MPTEKLADASELSVETSSDEAEIVVSFDPPGYSTIELDMAIAEMEAQELIAKNIDFATELPVHPIEGIEKGLVMEPTKTLAEKYPDFAPAFDFVMKSRGLTDYSQLTPEFIRNAVAENRQRAIADHAKRGIKVMSPEELREATARAYALIDDLAGPR